MQSKCLSRQVPYSTAPFTACARPRAVRQFLCLGLLTVLCWGSVAAWALGGETTLKLHGETMGTTWNVTLVDERNAEPTPDAALLKTAQTEIERTLQQVNQEMSTWQTDSELSRLNAMAENTEPVEISAPLARVLNQALEISRKTDGAYDVTVGPLVNLWKFGPRQPGDELPQEPTPEAIAEAKARVDWTALKLEEKDGVWTLQRTKPGQYVDLSSIAKGYGVDCVAETLEKLGVKRYMVEVGGEVRTAGLNPTGKPWNIGIQTPVPEATQLFATVNLGAEDSARALATSGDYRNFKTLDGKRLSHIIDPRTGRPVEHALVSVSVLAENCMTADGWATALLALGEEEGKRVAEAEHLAVLFLVQDEQEIRPVTVNFPAKFLNTPDAKARKAAPVILLQILVTVLLFLFFFIAVGFSHITGRRKLQCSCGAARTMEKEREQILKIKKSALQENGERTFK